jgi:hypothetical protein
MCTVTLIARARGYRLGMNRDEQLTRATALPPKRRKIDGRIVVCPSEPGGGAWIAVNDHGATHALINWYSISARVPRDVRSRGGVVNAVSAGASPESADAAFARLPLKQINPFRLIGVYPADRRVVEWRWDLRKLARVSHPWETQQWISSGFDEPAAQQTRSQTFRHSSRQKSAGAPGWLRRLHRSHSPATGPFSTCMHRTDAATVSYTEVVVFAGHGEIHYHAGAPCQSPACSHHRFHLRP